MTRRTPEADIQRAIVHTLRIVLPRQCGQFLPDAGNVGLEGFPGFRPGFGGMDVGAVGKHGGAVCAVLGNGVPLRGKMVENACAWDVPQAYIRFRSEEKFHGIAAFGVIRKRPFRRKEWL